MRFYKIFITFCDFIDFSSKVCLRLHHRYFPNTSDISGGCIGYSTYFHSFFTCLTTTYTSSSNLYSPKDARDGDTGAWQSPSQCL